MATGFTYKGLVVMVQTIVRVCRQKLFIKFYLKPLLKPYKTNPDITLSPYDFKKITNYYALAVPAVLGVAFCKLHQKKLTLTERKTLTHLGAVTGLFDDFFDKLHLPQAEIDQLITEPLQNKNSASAVRLFVSLYQQPKNNLINHPQFFNYCQQVKQAQINSLAQQNNVTLLPSNTLQKYTFKKGGYSLLFYRCAVNVVLTPPEEALLYQVGATMQLCNDIFDLHKDLQEGIQTLTTNCTNIDDLIALLTRQIQQVIELIKPLQNKQATLFFEIISLSVFARSYVCLQHYSNSQKNSGGIFTPHMYSRKQLVCNMESFAALKQALQYHAAIMQKYYLGVAPL
jgi:hypothetical protein